MADNEKEPPDNFDGNSLLVKHFRNDAFQENAKKRRRNPSSDDPTTSNVERENGDGGNEAKGDCTNEGMDPRQTSNLTVKNVADHVKRCREEEKASKEGDGESDRNMAVKCASLDEVVDNFSTMATDGSRHSVCGSCDCEEDKGEAMEAKQNDSPNDRKVEMEADGEKGPEDIVGPSGQFKGLDQDGNVVDADEIGEPNEPLLGRWEAQRTIGKSSGIKTPRGEERETDRCPRSPQSDDGSGNSSSSDEHASLMAASPSGGAMYYDARSPSSTDRGEASLDALSEDYVRRRSTSVDEEDGDSGRGKDGDRELDEDWPTPPHKWNAVKALRGREFGLPGARSPAWFRYYANGSLHFVQRLELMYKMTSHEGCVNCLHFNASGTRLASGSDDLNVIIWDWTTSQPLLTIETGHRANIFQAKFMPLSGDCHVVTCARDGQVRLAELSVRGVCKSTRKLAQHRGAANKVSLEIDSPHTFLSCGEDAVVYELDLRDPKPNKIVVCKEATSRRRVMSKVPLYSIHSHPRNPFYFATSGRDPYCRIYDKRMTGADCVPVKKFCPQHLLDNEQNKANVTAVVFNHDGTELLGTYNDDDIYLFSTDGSSEVEYKHRYKGHRNNATVKGVNFYGPHSEFIVSGSDCGYIYFWDKESERVVKFMPGDEGGVVNVLEPHPTCAILATSGLDHDVKIWVPSCEEPKFDVKLLQKLMRQNARERERERSNDTEFVDSQMLWYIMSRMRRAARRANPREGSDDSGPGEESAPETEDSDADEDSGEGPMAVQCRPQ